jgi:hypothetical protein
VIPLIFALHVWCLSAIAMAPNYRIPLLVLLGSNHSSSGNWSETGMVERTFVTEPQEILQDKSIR